MTSDFRGASADAVATLTGELEAAVSGSPESALRVAGDLFQVASTLRAEGASGAPEARNIRTPLFDCQ
mgnify:CR=1 FL=1